MAGNKNIYVVYDPKIEDSSTLSKFLGIVLEKAHYPIKRVEFITEENYLKLLEEQGVQHFTICLNKTYSNVSIKYGSLLDEMTFKFFSRYYHNPEKKIAVLGLLMDIETLFSDDNNKKTAWTKLVTLQKFYTENSSSLDDEPVQDVNVEEPNDDVPEVIKSSEEVHAEMNKVPQPKKVLEIKDAIVPPTKEPIPYEDLLSFYTLASNLLRDYEHIKSVSEKLGKLL